MKKHFPGILLVLLFIVAALVGSVIAVNAVPSEGGDTIPDSVELIITQGDTRTTITDLNKGDVFGDGSVKFRYDSNAQKGILTLNGASIESESDFPIDASGIDLLEIVLVGSNRIESPDTCVVANSLTFSGDGSIVINTKDPFGYTVDCYGGFTVSSGNVTVSGQKYGVCVDGPISVESGSLILKVADTNEGEAIVKGFDPPVIHIGDALALFAGESPDGSDAVDTMTTDTDKILAAKYIRVRSAHAHCICGGNTAVGDHTVHSDEAWIPWRSMDSLPDKAGSYYLVNDVTLTYELGVEAARWKVNGNINICLNGKTVSTNGSFAAIENASLSVTDCGSGGKIIGGVVFQDTAFSTYILTSVYVSNNSVFNLYGGTLLMGEEGKDPRNRIIDVYRDSTFNLYGGSIGDSSYIGTDANGNCLKTEAASSFNAYGGVIYGNTHFIVSSRIYFGDTAFASDVRLRKSYAEYYTGTPKLIGGARLVWIYPMYIRNGDTEITVDDLNKNDICGDGGSIKCEFDDTNKKATLTLANANIVCDNGSGSIINCGSDYSLDIVLVGDNAISPAEADVYISSSSIIKCNNQLTISGSGNLHIICNRSSAIKASSVTMSGTGNISIYSDITYTKGIETYGLTLESGNLSIRTGGLCMDSVRPNLNIKGGRLLLSSEQYALFDGNLSIGTGMILLTGASADGVNTVLTDVTDKNTINDAKYIFVSAAHTHCACGGKGFDGHDSHTDMTWQPWTATGSLPTAAGNYYLINDVILTGDPVTLPGGVNICLNGNKISDGKDFKGLIEITVADGGTFSVTDCGANGGIGNIAILSGKLVMYGGNIIEKMQLKIDNDASFLMTGNAENDNAIVIRGSANFTMSGNAKNNGYISLFETDKTGTVEFCGNADGGYVMIHEPQQDAKIRLYDNAKITELYTATPCTIGLVMQDNAVIGRAENLEFGSIELSGNAKLGSADSSFAIKTSGKVDTITVKDNVQILGTVTVYLEKDEKFVLGDKSAITGELIVKKMSVTGYPAKVVMIGESVIQGKLTCTDDTISFEMQDGTEIDGDIDIGESKVTGTVTCSGKIKSGIFSESGTVVNNGKISGGIFYGTVAGTGTIEDSAKVSVVFDSNGGSKVGTQKILRGQKAVKPAAPKKGGSSFAGWYRGYALYSFSTPVVSEITLKAQWNDTDKPVITELVDGKTYCGEVKFTVSSNNGVARVTVGNTVLTPDKYGYYILAAGIGKVTVTVTDNSGNKDEVTVTVNAGHTGGKATCAEKAVCENCGETYGELDPYNHAELIHVMPKPATKDEEGNTEYWYCESCGKYYSDAAATKEIKKSDTVIGKTPTDPDSPDTDSPDSPQTGDNGGLALWITLSVVCASACAFIIRKRKAFVTVRK